MVKSSGVGGLISLQNRNLQRYKLLTVFRRLYILLLQRYLTYYDQRKDQPLHVKISTPKVIDT